MTTLGNTIATRLDEFAGKLEAENALMLRAAQALYMLTALEQMRQDGWGVSLCTAISYLPGDIPPDKGWCCSVMHSSRPDQVAFAGTPDEAVRLCAEKARQS